MSPIWHALDRQGYDICPPNHNECVVREIAQAHADRTGVDVTLHAEDLRSASDETVEAGDPDVLWSEAVDHLQEQRWTEADHAIDRLDDCYAGDRLPMMDARLPLGLAVFVLNELEPPRARMMVGRLVGLATSALWSDR